MMKNKEEAREKSEFLCHSEHIMLLVLRICVRNFTYDLFFIFRARKKKVSLFKTFFNVCLDIEIVYAVVASYVMIKIVDG